MNKRKLELSSLKITESKNPDVINNDLNYLFKNNTMKLKLDKKTNNFEQEFE